MNILELFKYVFRGKSLNSILFLIVTATIRESLALGFDEGFEELFNLIIKKYGDEKGLVLIFIASIKFILSKGSWITLSILGALLLFIGFLKYKELSKPLDKRPYLDLQLYSNMNGPIQRNKGISHLNDPNIIYQVGEAKYNFEWEWKWELKIRNNSESTAYNVKLYFKANENPFDYIERLNSNNPIKPNELIELSCNVLIKKAISSNNSKEYREGKYPPEKGVHLLEILAEYQDGYRSTYYTLFKENSGQITNEYLKNKPMGFSKIH